MPEIGNPNSQNNPFKGIQKFQGQRPSAGNPNGKKDLGRSLDKIAGVKQDKFFVDQKKHNQMDKDSFLKLLSTQLANQDPFKPVDQKKFASDLAQFSQLEQLANLNSKFDKTADKAPSEMKQIGASFLGKQVETTGTTLNFNAETGSDVSMPFFLPQAAKNVMVRIFDSSNNMIQQLEVEDMGRGLQELSWNGDSLDGKQAASGTYRFEVRAWDNNFQQFKGETRAKGTVTGVNFEGDDVILMVDNKKKVFLKDVKNFSLPSGQTQNVAKQNLSDATKMPRLNKAAASAYNNINEQSQ
tara:strand:- start:14730 stop:15623 length:894 start_codon:yes stop_codon:yes gene_type:complete